jgi:hypothetical protein
MSVHEEYTYADLVPGNREVVWPVSAYHKHEFCNGATHITVEYSTKSCRGDFGRGSVFEYDGKRFYSNDTWWNNRCDGKCALKKMHFVTVGTEDVPEFSEHKDDEFFYFISDFEEPQTKAAVISNQIRTESAKEEIVARAARWNPATCDYSINQLRFEINSKTKVRICQCGHRASLRVVQKAGANRGAIYWSCILPMSSEYRCGYFCWAGLPQTKFSPY